MNTSNNQQERQEALRRQYQAEFSKHVFSYPIQLVFPANIILATDRKNVDTKKDELSPLRTQPDFINMKLLKSGLDFKFKETDETTLLTPPTSFIQVTQMLNRLVKELDDTDCYDDVQIVIGRNSEDDETQTTETASSVLHRIDVILREKNWYKLYIGGGLKQDTGRGIHGSGNSLAGNDYGGLLPVLQFETNGSLLNLTGHCDITRAEYTLDQTSTPSMRISHSRPLYTLFGDDSPLQDTLLSFPSPLGCSIYSQVDTIDCQHVRSSKDHIQRVGICIANTIKGAATAAAGGKGSVQEGKYYGLDWSLSRRDILPRRSINIPYVYDTSPEIILASGPSLKHSLIAEIKTNGTLMDDKFNPTVGLDSYGGFELAGPPGNVGFFKFWGGGAFHTTIEESIGGIGMHRNWLYKLAFHSTIHGGMIQPLTYGGLCSNGSSNVTNILDRFYVGGSNQLRGFLPSGIGPRAETGGSSSPGDALGGDVFYTSTLALSLPFPGVNVLSKNGLRLFGFVNSGTLVGLSDASNLVSFINSSRIAVGCGVSMGTPLGRIETTYALPLRFSNKDARRSVQFGIGLNFG